VDARKSDTQQQGNSSPNVKERLPHQARTSNNNFSTINNFTGTVSFYGGFPGKLVPRAFPLKVDGAGKGPGIGWSRVHLTP